MKRFISTLCNDILVKSLWTSYTGQSAGSFNPVNLAEIRNSSEKWFHNLLQTLVGSKLVTYSLADDEKKEFQKFMHDVVRENKTLFRNYNINSQNLENLLKGQYSIQIFHLCDSTYTLKMVLTSFHGQADVERGFSLNKKLVIENMSAENARMLLTKKPWNKKRICKENRKRSKVNKYRWRNNSTELEEVNWIAIK